MRTTTLLAAALVLVACNKQNGNRPPEPASAATQPQYAEEYPAALDSQTQAFDEDAGGVEEASASIPTYGDELSEPTDYDVAADVVVAADEAGRSEPYAEAARERDAIKSFFEDDDRAVTRKVASGVQYAAKQQGCEDVGGAAAGALERTLDEELEKKMRDANHAHDIIDRHEEDLGKQNAEALRDQADEIAEASYTAFIELPRRKYELERMIEEGSTARSTIEREIELADETIGDPDASDEEVEAAEARLPKLEDALAKLDEKLDKAKAKQKKLEQQVQAAQQRYDEALDQLIVSLEDKAAGAAPGGEA